MLKFNRLYKVSHFIFKLSGFIYSGQRLSWVKPTCIRIAAVIVLGFRKKNAFHLMRLTTLSVISIKRVIYSLLPGIGMLFMEYPKLILSTVILGLNGVLQKLERM